MYCVDYLKIYKHKKHSVSHTNQETHLIMLSLYYIYIKLNMILDILQSFTSNKRVPPSYVHGLVILAVCPTNINVRCFQMLKKVLYRARRDTLFLQYLYDSDCLSSVFSVFMD